MPYANLNEAFDDFTDTFSNSSSNTNNTSDLRNPNYYNRQSSVGTRYGQVGGADRDSSNTVRQGELAGAPFNRVNNNINMIQNTFDMSDDVPEIAANYIPDKYNMKYSGHDDWDVIDPDIKGVTAPRNPGLVASPDRIISPITQQRTVLDKIWQRPVSADIDTYNINQRNQLNNADRFGGIGTAPGRTSMVNNNHMIRAPTFQENLTDATSAGAGVGAGLGANGVRANGVGANGVGANGVGVGVGSSGENVSNMDTCSGQNCLDMLEKIMKCEECVKKLRKLLGIQDKNSNWFDLSEVNVSKLVFWVIVIILIVAVYELLNTLMARIRG